MRKALVALAVLAGAGALTLLGAPAQAQGVTFSVSGGLLSITEPADTSLTGGSIATLAGSAVTGTLGTTSVTDQRGGIVGWTASIAQTAAFTNTTTTIPVGNTKVWLATPPTVTGIATANSGLYLTQATGLSLLATPQAFVTATAVVGNNTATFNPSIAVTIPSNATAGSYSGTIAQTIG